MPISPAFATDAVVTCRVLLGGIKNLAAVVSIEVQHAAGRLPSACVVMAEVPMTGGDAEGDSDGDWPLSNGDTCLPGTAIEIQAGHGASRDTIFKGLITRLRVSADSRGPRLTLDCIDANSAPALDAEPTLVATWGQDLEAFDAQLESAQPPDTVTTVAVHGTARVQGSAQAQVGGLLQLAGVGQRFAGTHRIGRVEHRIADGGWVTDVGFGPDPT